MCVYGEMSIENTELTALPVLPFAALLGAVFIFAIFALAIHRYDEEQGIPFAAVTCAIFAGLAFPLMFSCLLRLRMMPAIGMLQVFLPLAISFGSDTFALFAGMLCGKHKLAPRSAPKDCGRSHRRSAGWCHRHDGFKLVADSMAHTLTVYPPIEMAAGSQISWGQSLHWVLSAAPSARSAT
ncbi:MAG: phosphatidate cytidylyltransferase [Dysosmobacter welbionis]